MGCALRVGTVQILCLFVSGDLRSLCWTFAKNGLCVWQEFVQRWPAWKSSERGQVNVRSTRTSASWPQITAHCPPGLLCDQILEGNQSRPWTNGREHVRQVSTDACTCICCKLEFEQFAKKEGSCLRLVANLCTYQLVWADARLFLLPVRLFWFDFYVQTRDVATWKGCSACSETKRVNFQTWTVQ